MAARPAQRAVSHPASLPSPVGGWNARDSLPEMAATDAVYLTNWFPSTTDCQLRAGFTRHAVGMPAQVETLMNYAGGTTSALLAIAAGNVYDATGAGTVGAPMVTGLTNSRWEYTNIATPGGNFLVMANGTDTPYLYDGTTWTSITGSSTPAITGVTTTTLGCPILHKNRLWFIERDSLKAWYLPTLSIGGEAKAIDMSAVAQMGGYLVAIATWTIDAGTGVDDLFVAVTNQGEVIVYQGTDPASADAWALRGVWRVGAPVGARCLFKFSGDLLMISQDGVLPLSAALQSSRVNPKVALTDKIQRAVSDAVTISGGNFGWQLLYYPQQNQLWLNVPVQTGVSQEQYAMNTITKNWCNYTGWEANCWCLFNDQPFFGANGFVGQAWNGLSDGGNSINGLALQAFNDFRNPGVLKRFTMARPMFRTNGAPTILASMNVDFDFSDTSAPLNFAPVSYGVWDQAVWDQAIWGGDLNVAQAWQSITGLGYYGGLLVKTASSGIEVRWVSTDVVYETGAIL